MDNRPIGVFDSGLGGLTAVKELIRTMPEENIVYFGDTARVPYGSHDRETVIEFARQDLAFLLSRDVKAVLVACGTVSATALPELRRMTSLPVIGVVEAAAREAVGISENGRIAVLATGTSIKSHAYSEIIGKIAPDAFVAEQACPLFVPLVENGYVERDNEVTRMVARDYVAKIARYGADTFILGCTHYPIIRDIIADAALEITGCSVNMVEAGLSAVNELGGLLCERQMRTDRTCRGSTSFFVSEAADGFAEIGERFLGRKITGHVEKISIG